MPVSLGWQSKLWKLICFFRPPLLSQHQEPRKTFDSTYQRGPEDKSPFLATQGGEEPLKLSQSSWGKHSLSSDYASSALKCMTSIGERFGVLFRNRKYDHFYCGPFFYLDSPLLRIERYREARLWFRTQEITGVIKKIVGLWFQGVCTYRIFLQKEILMKPMPPVV